MKCISITALYHGIGFPILICHVIHCFKKKTKRLELDYFSALCQPDRSRNDKALTPFHFAVRVLTSLDRNLPCLALSRINCLYLSFHIYRCTVQYISFLAYLNSYRSWRQSTGSAIIRTELKLPIVQLIVPNTNH